jgi:hypothetical protein
MDEKRKINLNDIRKLLNKKYFHPWDINNGIKNPSQMFFNKIKKMSKVGFEKDVPPELKLKIKEYICNSRALSRYSELLAIFYNNLKLT